MMFNIFFLTLFKPSTFTDPSFPLMRVFKQLYWFDLTIPFVYFSVVKVNNISVSGIMEY